MPLADYPKLLTDPAWKKVEKAAGVSATGVGKTLRDAEGVWRTLAGEIAGLEKGQVTKAKADEGKKAAIAAFGKSAAILKGLLPKVTNPGKKAILQDYSNVVAYLIRDLTSNFNLVNDHRDLDFVISKFNAHVEADLSGFKHPV